MATDFDIARTQYETYRFGYDNGHAQWLKQARKSFDFWSGVQWDAAQKAQLEREGRPALTLNIIESLVRAMKGIHKALTTTSGSCRPPTRHWPTRSCAT